MEKKKKEFDAVKWVRSVRDEHHHKWGHLPMDQYMKKLSEEAEKSELAKKFKKENRGK